MATCFCFGVYKPDLVQRGGIIIIIKKENEERRRRWVTPLSARTWRKDFSPSALRVTSVGGFAVKCFSPITLSIFSPVSSGRPFNLSILLPSFKASLNLVAICTLVAWMQKSGKLPIDTPSILSQVSFNLLIPCFLMSKVSRTVASQPIGTLLWMPSIALLQVLLGGIFGKIVCELMKTSSSTSKMANLLKPVLKNDSSSKAEESLLLPPEEVAKGEALITMACAFGNSLTLPLVFLAGLLPPQDLNIAVGYLALYLVGWSPSLWSVGYYVLFSANGDNQPNDSSMFPPLSSFMQRAKQIFNPPLYGVLAGLIVGLSPLSSFFLAPKENLAMIDGVANTRLLSWSCSVLNMIGQTVSEAASLLGSATLPVQTIVLASSLAISMPSLSHIQNSDNLNGSKERKSLSETKEKEAKPFACVSNLSTLFQGKAFWFIALVRFLIMPFVSLWFIQFMSKRGLMPADPIFILTVLVEAVMPTAQNLVVLTQLQAKTRPLAGILANLLVRQFALALVPLTLWTTVFLEYSRAFSIPQTQ